MSMASNGNCFAIGNYIFGGIKLPKWLVISISGSTKAGVLFNYYFFSKEIQRRK